MEDIPMPILLDPERPRLTGKEHNVDAAGQAELLQHELDRVTAYGRHLWSQLHAVRVHLVESLPDPGADTEPERLLTAPRGAGDDAGWQRWQAAYAAVTSALAGPGGDSGFGRHEAALETRARRGLEHSGAPGALQVAVAEHARLQVEDQRADSRPAVDGLQRPASRAGLAPVAAAVGVVAFLVGRWSRGRQVIP